MNNPIVLAIHVCFFGLIIGAMYTDMTTRKVPNWLTYPAIYLGVVLNIFAQDDWLAGLSHASMGFAVGFGLFCVLFALNVLDGAGDVKLMGAIGALTGWWFTANVILHTALIGGVVAMLALFIDALSKMLEEDSDENPPAPEGAAAKAAASGANPPKAAGMEERADGVPVHVVEVEGGKGESKVDVEGQAGQTGDGQTGEGEGEGDGGAGGEDAGSNPGDQAPAESAPAASSDGKPVKVQGQTFIPYGLCIALGGFATWIIQKGNFGIPISLGQSGG